MDFNFSDEQEQLRDAVRKWVDKGYDFERRRGIVAHGGFSREAYGEFYGFLFGWMVLFINFSGTVAALAVGFATYGDEVLRRVYRWR